MDSTSTTSTIAAHAAPVLVRRLSPVDGDTQRARDTLLSREWLVTNGLGGYASGTVAGVATRRYHGLLIAALPSPHGRTMTVNRLSERIRLPDGEVVAFDAEHRMHEEPQVRLHHLEEFRLEAGLPVWRFRLKDFVLERSVSMVHRQNTVHVSYRVLEGEGRLRIKVQPCVHFRSHDASVSAPIGAGYGFHADQGRFEVVPEPPYPPLRMHVHGGECAFTYEPRLLERFFYDLEARRGYDHQGDLWTPGYFRFDAARGRPSTLTFSTEPWKTLLALRPEEALAAERQRRQRLVLDARPEARDGMGAELVLAADAFIIRPAGRAEDEARLRASGDEARTVIAGYHWFTDWGRDTMISLPGLTLATGRAHEGRYILHTFAHYVRDGLLPNLFPDGEREALYHTADATLWYFQAIRHYLEATEDEATLAHLLPTLVEIVRRHLHGTRFSIGVDPADGLLRQGAEGYQLTWMDAKVGDWVVTPRRGKAVELQALWHAALSCLASWLRGGAAVAVKDAAALAAELDGHATRVRESFAKRFWYEPGGYLFDVVDGPEGDDPALRPNQVFAIALDPPLLAEDRWARVVEVVERELWTPVGLRSLARGHVDYKARYDGDLRARDAAYHQGTVWAWLVGPFVDAWIRTHPGREQEARKFLRGFEEHLGEACLGTISEIFDAEPPFSPRGCAAQAWSVAEVLRAWVKTATRA